MVVVVVVIVVGVIGVVGVGETVTGANDANAEATGAGAAFEARGPEWWEVSMVCVRRWRAAARAAAASASSAFAASKASSQSAGSFGGPARTPCSK